MSIAPRSKLKKDKKMKNDKINNNNAYIRDSQIAYANLRQKDQMKMEGIRTAIHQQRHHEFLEIRRQRDINDAKVRDFKDKVVETKRDQSLRIKEQEVTSKMRYNQYHANRAKEYKRSYDQEAFLQESLRRQKQLELTSLENLEQEILSRLRQTEKVEQQVNSQVEEALELSPKEFSSKYSSELKSPKKRIYSVGKRRKTPSRAELLHDIQLSLKNNLDDSFRLNLSPAKSTRNDKYLQNDWMNKEERISREQKIYGRPETPKSRGAISILEKITVSRVPNLNRSMYDHGEATSGSKTSGRKYDKFSPMIRNKSLGTDVSGASDRVITDHDHKQEDHKDKTLSIEVMRSKPGSRNNIDKLRSSSNQKPRKSNLIGSKHNIEKGRSRATTSYVNSQVTSRKESSKENSEKEEAHQTKQNEVEKAEKVENVKVAEKVEKTEKEEKVDVVPSQQAIEKEQDEVIEKESSGQVENKIEEPQKAVEIENHNDKTDNHTENPENNDENTENLENHDDNKNSNNEAVQEKEEESNFEPEPEKIEPEGEKKEEPEVEKVESEGEKEESKPLEIAQEEKQEETARQEAQATEQQVAAESS